jgi:CPA2 family monovalent cation:H+ antiporter-2
MLLDPRQIPGILWLVAIIVPITILGEVIITSSSAYFSGFSVKSSIDIGTSMIARGEYSLIFASLGFSAGAISETLYQFTGVYVFIMTLLAPMAMKNSNKIRSGIYKLTPSFIKYSSRLISITMKPMLLPEESGIRPERSYKFIFSFAIYLAIAVTAFIIKNIYVLIMLSVIGLAIVFILRKLFMEKVRYLENQINYHDMHKGAFNMESIRKFISNSITAFLTIIILGAAFWNYGYIVLLALLSAFAIYLIVVSVYVYNTSRTTFKI